MQTSRRQFERYRERIRRRGQKTEPPAAARRKAQTEHPRTWWDLFRDFWKLLRGHRAAVAFALGSLTLATLIKLLPPYSIKLAIDYVLAENPPPVTHLQAWGLPTDRLQLLLVLVAAVVVTSLLASVLHLWGRWYATRTVNRVQVGLRKRVFEHAVRLPLHRVYEIRSGGAASILREDTGGAAELIFSMLYNPWRAIVQFVGSLLVLTLVDWRMMLGGTLLLPVVYYTHRTWIRRIRPLWRDVRAQRETIDATATESFGGMRIVRAFARERTEAGRFVRRNDLLIRQQLFVWWWSRGIDLIWDALIPLASTGLLGYGGYRILQGQMTLGDLTMFLFYLAMLLEPLATLVASATSFQNNLAGLDRVLDLLGEPREMPDRPHALSLDANQVRGQLDLESVHFHYPNSAREVLSGIHMRIEAGETVALVGRSGAGKTTLCNLVARFYDPAAGRIRLDGHDLRDIRLESYRKLFGIVEQDVFLFDGSIGENICYGRRAAGTQDIVAASQAANAHEFIEQLEQGYQTTIGERGVKLSGGQRQRLAIARALLADPKILILDEATSNLDTASERLIQQSLKRLMQGRTCLVIAHRMSTVLLADRIAVLEAGRLVEWGSHAELMSRNSRFRQMVELQMDSSIAAHLASPAADPSGFAVEP